MTMMPGWRSDDALPSSCLKVIGGCIDALLRVSNHMAGMRNENCKLTLLWEQPIAAGVVISWTLYYTTCDCGRELVTHCLYKSLPDISTVAPALLCLWLLDWFCCIPDMMLDFSGYSLLVINEPLRLCVSVISVSVMIFVTILCSGGCAEWCDRSNSIGEGEGWERTDQAELTVETIERWYSTSSWDMSRIAC